MLKIRGVVSSLFNLVLGVLFKLAPNAINKSLKLSKVFLEKDFKLWPCDWSKVFVTAFILGLSKADYATEKIGGKRSMIYLYNA